MTSLKILNIKIFVYQNLWVKMGMRPANLWPLWIGVQNSIAGSSGSCVYPSSNFLFHSAQDPCFSQCEYSLFNNCLGVPEFVYSSLIILPLSRIAFPESATFLILLIPQRQFKCHFVYKAVFWTKVCSLSLFSSLLLPLTTLYIFYFEWQLVKWPNSLLDQASEGQVWFLLIIIFCWGRGIRD
jgi:hypothetical protein